MNAPDARHDPEMTSPAQAAIGSLFGGPLAFACFVRGNYVAIGRPTAANAASAAGVLLGLACNAAIALGILLPEPLPFLGAFVFPAMPLALMIAAYPIARRQIGSRGHGLRIRSNMRVFGTVALCLLASGFCALVTIIVALAALLASSRFRT